MLSINKSPGLPIIKLKQRKLWNPAPQFRAYRDDSVAPACQSQHLLEEHLSCPTDWREEDDGTSDALWTCIIQRPHLAVIIINNNLKETVRRRWGKHTLQTDRRCQVSLKLCAKMEFIHFQNVSQCGEMGIWEYSLSVSPVTVLSLTRNHILNQKPCRKASAHTGPSVLQTASFPLFCNWYASDMFLKTIKMSVDAVLKSDADGLAGSTLQLTWP